MVNLACPLFALAAAFAPQEPEPPLPIVLGVSPTRTALLHEEDFAGVRDSFRALDGDRSSPWAGQARWPTVKVLAPVRTPRSPEREIVLTEVWARKAPSFPAEVTHVLRLTDVDSKRGKPQKPFADLEGKKSPLVLIGARAEAWGELWQMTGTNPEKVADLYHQVDYSKPPSFLRTTEKKRIEVTEAEARAEAIGRLMQKAHAIGAILPLWEARHDLTPFIEGLQGEDGLSVLRQIQWSLLGDAPRIPAYALLEPLMARFEADLTQLRNAPGHCVACSSSEGASCPCADNQLAQRIPKIVHDLAASLMQSMLPDIWARDLEERTVLYGPDAWRALDEIRGFLAERKVRQRQDLLKRLSGEHVIGRRNRYQVVWAYEDSRPTLPWQDDADLVRWANWVASGLPASKKWSRAYGIRDDRPQVLLYWDSRSNEREVLESEHSKNMTAEDVADWIDRALLMELTTVHTEK